MIMVEDKYQVLKIYYPRLIENLEVHRKQQRVGKFERKLMMTYKKSYFRITCILPFFLNFRAISYQIYHFLRLFTSSYFHGRIRETDNVIVESARFF